MDKTKDTPYIVRVKDFRIDSDYSSWLSDIIKRYREAQIKAALKVNYEKLQFNWSIGRDLVIRKAEERWGSGVVEQLSFDLQDAFPNEKGFSSRNMWNNGICFSPHLKHPKNCPNLGQNCKMLKSNH